MPGTEKSGCIRRVRMTTRERELLLNNAFLTLSGGGRIEKEALAIQTVEPRAVVYALAYLNSEDFANDFVEFAAARLQNLEDTRSKLLHLAE